tara:strand:+ start:882 stop:2576 length:1695 start_codon:yes stop_codon:yes gene_type:complete
MSASLFFRELKRLLALTLAAVFLPAFVYLTILVLRQTALAKDVPDLDDSRGLVLALAVLIAPWILGAASFAPERESGAASFLARLPLPAWKLLLLRSGAIMACLACLHIPVWGLASAWDLPSRSMQILLGASGASLALLAAAVYASLSLKRSLSAFAAGPVLVWSGFWVLALPWAAFGTRLSGAETVGGSGLLVVGALVCLAWAAKAQKPLSGLHPIRFTWRPLVVLCLLNAGTAGAITLADRTHFSVSVGPLFQTSGDTLGQTIHGNRGTRQVVQSRHALITRGGKVALLPEGHSLIGLSSTMAFTHSRQGDWHGAAIWRLADLKWCDPKAPRATPEEVANISASRLYRGHATRGPLGYKSIDLLWIGELPCEVKPGWIVSATGARGSYPAEWQIRSGGGSRVIARTPGGEFRLFQASEQQGLGELSSPAAWVDLAPLFPDFMSLDDVLLSDSGETLLAYGRDAAGLVVAGLDLRAEQPQAVVFLRPATQVRSEWSEASPSAVSVQWELPTNHYQSKTWDPTPPAPLSEGLQLPVGEGKGYLLVGGDLHYGSLEGSVEVDLFD